jgi:phosphopantothenoylcysteine synthetase/decarboxylase
MNVPAYIVGLRNKIELSVRVLLTHSAERFVQRQVVAWHADEVYSSDDPALNPTEFAKRSRGIVVLPATANMLAAGALGLAATPAQTVLLASERPALFFPSMNASMWEKNAIQRHIATLRSDGHTVVEPQQRQVFEMWRRDVTVGATLPTPSEAAETIIRWLDDGLPAPKS